MDSANGNGHHSENKARLVFWEVTKGCNLRCIHCRATATELEFAYRPIHPTRAWHHRSDCRIRQPHSRPQRRRAAVSLRHLSTRALCDRQRLRVALATNGTLVTKDVARMIVDSGVHRVSISLDGADAVTHDTFRGIPGAFDAAVHGLRNLKALGMSVQINMTIARHNAHQLPEVSRIGQASWAPMRCTPSCWCRWAAESTLPPSKWWLPKNMKSMLNWFYDQSLTGGIELKATCAPHYFRVARQRRAAERRAGAQLARIAPAASAYFPQALRHRAHGNNDAWLDRHRI